MMRPSGFLRRRLRRHPGRHGATLAAVLLAWLATLAAPFLLRPEQADFARQADRRLVILTPHNERVRHEIGQAFVADWKARTGETVYLDWRIPGGSSEIILFLTSEFAGAFQYYWQSVTQHPWTRAIAAGFADPRTPPSAAADSETGAISDARRAFLASNLGIGVDLLFGGGAQDVRQLAEAGYLVAGDAAAGTGLAAIERWHPDWFGPAVIPLQVSGEPFRDPAQRWCGVVLASFGIVSNTDALARLGLGQAPAQWSALTEPRLAGQLALADPSKSGSVAKAFELMIQQQMRQAVDRLTAVRPDQVQAEAEGVRQGWLAGLRLIQSISANARYFTDSASKIPQEVARGDAAAGMAIDSYGRTMAEAVRRPDGRSRVQFRVPEGGSSVSVDPVAMLRGAPDPILATAFMEFLLSPRGQTLWALSPGTPGGPQTTALRRWPVRRDFYTTANRPYMTDPEEQPYALAERFAYQPVWTGPLFGALRFLIRVICVDLHEEQRAAWRAIIDAGAPPPALAAFHDLSGLDYDTVRARIAPVLQGKDKAQEIRLARELGEVFRARYRRARQLAEAAGGRT